MSDKYAALKQAAESNINILENIAGFEPEDIDGDAVELRFEDENGCDTGCDVSIVAQCQSAADVIGLLLAERDADKRRIAEQCGIILSARKFIGEYAGLGDVGATEFLRIIDRAAGISLKIEGE